MPQPHVSSVFPICPKCGSTTRLEAEAGQFIRRCTTCKWIETSGIHRTKIIGSQFCILCGRYLSITERMKTGTGQCSVCQAQTATLSPSAQSSDTSDLGTSPHSAEPCSSFDELHFNLTNAKQFALILLRKRRYARMRIAGYILLPIS